MSDEIKWRHWEDSCSECGRAYVGGLKVIVQDCDGDFTRWNVLRGNSLVATGEVHGILPYHFDTAKEQSVLVAKAIAAADEYRAMQMKAAG